MQFYYLVHLNLYNFFFIIDFCSIIVNIVCLKQNYLSLSRVYGTSD